LAGKPESAPRTRDHIAIHRRQNYRNSVIA
jgi:hypothetical protein